jgi:dimethylargininase
MNFTRAIIRTVGRDAARGLTTAGLGAADLTTLKAQHAAYVEALGLEVTRLEALPECPDAYFVEDTAVLVPEVAVLTRPGAPSRRPEVDAMEPTLRSLFPVIHRLTAPATLDGGDVLQIDRRVYVGLSSRTNKEGAEQLKAALAPWGYAVVPVAVPDGLHLKSNVTWVGDAVVVTRALASEFRDFDQHVVADEESYAANVLMVNGKLLVPAGFPRTRELLARYRVVELDQSEVRKLDGALTCMSLRF